MTITITANKLIQLGPLGKDATGVATFLGPAFLVGVEIRIVYTSQRQICINSLALRRFWKLIWSRLCPGQLDSWVAWFPLREDIASRVVGQYQYRGLEFAGRLGDEEDGGFDAC